MADEADQAPPKFSLPAGHAWLNHPSQLEFVFKEKPFSLNTRYKFISLQACSDMTSKKKRMCQLGIFMVSHYRYKPAQDWKTKALASGKSGGNKANDNISRIIWLIDLFGITGSNMAAIVMNRGENPKIYGHCTSARDTIKVG